MKAPFLLALALLARMALSSAPGSAPGSVPDSSLLWSAGAVLFVAAASRLLALSGSYDGVGPPPGHAFPIDILNGEVIDDYTVTSSFTPSRNLTLRGTGEPAA